MNKKKSTIKDLNIKIKECYQKLNNKTVYFEPIFIITLTLLFAFIVIGSMKVALDEPVINIAENTAEELFYDGKYAEAIAEYEKMQNEEAWPIYKLKIAEIYSMQGEYDKSNSLLKEVVIVRNRLLESKKNEYIEKDKAFINEVVNTFYINGQANEAIALAEDYLVNENNYKPLIKTLFSAYLSSGQVDKAEGLIANYPLDEESAYDISNFAKMQIMVGKIDEGLATLRKAWEKNNDEVNVFNVISEVSYYDKDGILKKITELATENPDVDLYNLLTAQIYATSSENSGKVEELINLVDKDVSKVNGHIIKAEAYLLDNRETEAKEEIEKAIKNNKEDFIDDYLEAWIKYYEEDYLKAYEYAKKSIINNSNYDNSFGVLIPQIMISWEKVDIAEGFLYEALAKDPINYNNIVKVAEYYRDVKLNYDKSQKYYSLALGISPNKEEISYIQASVELLRENYDGAKKFLETVVSIKPTDGKYFRTLGYVYLQLGENEKAIESFRNAFSLNEKDVLALNNAACYYISVEKDIWRGYSNIEAAYNDMPEDLDEESKLVIEENYKKAVDILDKYVEDGEKVSTIPELKYFK